MAMAAAVRVAFTWWGVHKALTVQQKEEVCDATGADARLLSAGKKTIDVRHEAFRRLTYVRTRWRTLLVADLHAERRAGAVHTRPDGLGCTWGFSETAMVPPAGFHVNAPVCWSRIRERYITDGLEAALSHKPQARRWERRLVGAGKGGPPPPKCSGAAIPR
jgi:hypothetical protein